MIDFKKYNLDTIGTKKTSRKKAEITYQKTAENRMLLERCMRHWDSLSDFRERAFRNQKYYRGDQWSEKMEHPDTGETITEENYIRSTGRIPLKQNIIRIMVKNVLGQFRVNKTKSVVVSRKREGAKNSEMLTNALQSVHDTNHSRELDVRELEKFLLSGGAGYKIRYKTIKSRDTEDVYYKSVNMYNLFFNTDLSDIRLDNLRLIGEFTDQYPDSVIAAFADTPERAKEIRDYYSASIDLDNVSSYYGLDSQRIRDANFLFPPENDKWRVYEIWELRAEWRLYVHDYADGTYKIDTRRTRADIAAENRDRIQMASKHGIPPEKVPLIEARMKYDEYWYGKYLTPLGDVLWEGETPYEHGEHPFVLLLYPLVNGEVWGFVEDIIDQQRYVNRLISMIDFIIGNSAKGVLLAPDDSVPDEEDPETWASKWSKFDGVMFYKPKPGVDPPRQVVANSVNVGANELLALQMKLMQEISGIHGAIQGKEPNSGTPAKLYAQETENATLNTLDMIEIFNWFRKQRDVKTLKTLIQYYDKRNILISGRDYDDEVTEFDPDAVKNIEWELVISQSADTPVYRAMIDDLLMNLLDRQAIDLEMYLENTSAPFAEKMLQQLRSKREEAARNGNLAQMLPEMQQQAEQQADPRMMEMINR